MFSPLLKIVLQALLGVIKIRGPEGRGGGRTWETLFRRIESPRNLPGQLLIQALASSPLSGKRWCNFIFCVLRVQKLIFFLELLGTDLHDGKGNDFPRSRSVQYLDFIFGLTVSWK